MKARKGKLLEGAPPRSRVKRPREKKPGAGKHRGSLLFLLFVALVVLGGMGFFTWRMGGWLNDGLLAQREQLRRRPDWVPLERLPPHVTAAFQAVVDTSSWKTALTASGRHAEPQASRDLVRQVHRLEGTPGGEARELVLVPLLEGNLSRRELLEFYLNRISLGRTGDWPVYGVFHAAREYFGKDPRSLSLGEAATLAGVLLPPRLDNPETSPGAVGARRNEVLRRMLSAGKIDEAQFRAAAAEPLGFQPGADYDPMSRPPDWKAEPEVIRLPASLRPRADSAAASPAAP